MTSRFESKSRSQVSGVKIFLLVLKKSLAHNSEHGITGQNKSDPEDGPLQIGQFLGKKIRALWRHFEKSEASVVRFVFFVVAVVHLFQVKGLKGGDFSGIHQKKPVQQYPLIRSPEMGTSASVYYRRGTMGEQLKNPLNTPLSP